MYLVMSISCINYFVKLFKPPVTAVKKQQVIYYNFFWQRNQYIWSWWIIFSFFILLDCNNKCFHWKWMRVNFDKLLLFLDAVASQVFAPVSHWQTPHHLPKFKPPHWLSHACYILVDLIQFVTDHCRRF